VKLGPLRTLQAKAILLAIAIVAGVLALSTFFNVQVSERALERDLRDKAIALARQFAAGIDSWEELKGPEQLQAMIDQVMEPRFSIVGMAVYAMTEGGSRASPPGVRKPRMVQVRRSPRRP
jgi:sensor histidine kinase regulating citrate/malate metabolism